MLRALWGEGDWDLFVAIFGESHAAGHQQWHLHDETHPRFDEAARKRAGGDPILQVYRAIDAEVGRLIALAPPDATILVHLSHGMTAHHDGTHLLEELVARLDGKRARNPAKPPLPALRHVAQKLGVPMALRAAVGQRLRGTGARARARSRFFATPNNSVVGGIRFNLAGREPHGRVEPDEVEGLIAELERELLALRNVDTGGPVVRAVHRCADHYERDPTDTMPDLFIEWERNAPIETIASPKIGTLHTPYTQWRTGDHTSNGLLIARGAGIPVGAEMPAIEVEDLAPTIAARFGVSIDEADGRIMDWLVACADSRAAALA
jgi:predicted AlkP superfamily phosphohydrolase/phosphomutase